MPPVSRKSTLDQRKTARLDPRTAIVSPRISGSSAGRSTNQDRNQNADTPCDINAIEYMEVENQDNEDLNINSAFSDFRRSERIANMNARKRQAMQALLTDPNIDVMEYHQENILSNNQNPVTNGQDLNQYSVFEDIIIPNAQEQTPYSVSEDINMSNAQEQNQTVHSLPTIQNINVMEYQQENTLSNNQNPVTAGHVSVEICISNGQERKKYSVSQDIVIPNAQERNQCSVSQEIVIPNAQEQNQALNSLPTNQNIHVMEYQEDKTLCNYQNQVTNCNVSEDIIIPIAQEQNQGSVSEEQTQCPPTKVLRRSARIALMNANKQCKIKEPGVKDEKIRGTKKTIAMKKKAKKSVLKKLASKGTQTEFILEQVTSNANMQPTSIARQSYDRAAQTLQDTAGSSNAFQLIGDYFSRFFR